MDRTVKLSQIIIPDNRQRREFKPDELNELSESIKNQGLFHAPVVREQDGKFYLVAGERRLRAIADIYELGGCFAYNDSFVPQDHVPVVTLGTLSELEAAEAELEENIRRSDLTWQERATATAALAKLRAGQAAERGEAPPTVAKIAEEVRGSALGSNQEATRKEILLARHLDDPEVKKAKTLDEAFKVVKRQEQVRKNEEKAVEVGKTFTASQHTCLNMDSMEWLNTCPDEAFDVILMDPPYGMGADEFGDSNGKCGGGHFYDDTAQYFYGLAAKYGPESFRITKEEAHLYCFCDIEKFQYLKDVFTKAGWDVFRTPLIWYKPQAFRAPWPEHGPQRKYETLLYAKKGDRKVMRLFPDVITCGTDENLGHQAQKPVELFANLLSRSVRPGDTVLDLFCGSGPIFPAAHSLQCAATGIELDPAAYAISVGRIQALKE